MSTIDIRDPYPTPLHHRIERSPSQPSLSHSHNTDHSDEHATTPTSVYHHGTMGPPVAQDDPRAKTHTSGLKVKSGTKLSTPIGTPESLARSSVPSPATVPDSPASFTDKRAKRLSLSRSFQNLRDKAADKSAKRRSSVSSSSSTPPPTGALPPVPTVPEMYRKPQLKINPDFAGSPDPRRTASATASIQTSRSASTNHTPNIDSPINPPQATPSPPTSTRTRSGGFGAFLRKLTGRNKEPKPKPDYRYRRRATTESAAATASLNRLRAEHNVPHVPPPASVRGVLAEMGQSSSAAETRNQNRKSVIKRVPVPTYDPHSDEMGPSHRSGEKRKKDVPPMPHNAAEARAAALSALEGSPVLSTSPRLPSTPFSYNQDVPLVTMPEIKRPDLVTLDSDDSGAIIQTVSASPPVVTHVVVMEPESIQEPPEDDLASDEGPPISPVQQAVKIVATPRSPSGSSTGSGAVSSLRRLSRSNKLSDFGTYDSDEGSDEDADVVRPLQLRIPKRMASVTIPEDGTSGSPLSPHTPVSSISPMTNEDGPDTPISSTFSHGQSTISRHATSEFGYGGLDRSNSIQGSGRDSPYSLQYSASLSRRPSRDPRFAGSRSAYVAPVGDSLADNPHRRNSGPSSRIRVAGSSLSRRLSQKPKEPPTSHDAYMQKQAQLASARQSCRPVIHSRASIAAEMSEVRDKDANQVMETFFMS